MYVSPTATPTTSDYKILLGREFFAHIEYNSITCLPNFSDIPKPKRVFFISLNTNRDTKEEEKLRMCVACDV